MINISVKAKEITFCNSTYDYCQKFFFFIHLEQQKHWKCTTVYKLDLLILQIATLRAKVSLLYGF